jgi:hypothetical protein
MNWQPDHIWIVPTDVALLRAGPSMNVKGLSGGCARLATAWIEMPVEKLYPDRRRMYYARVACIPGAF